jgi:endoglucanase
MTDAGTASPHGGGSVAERSPTEVLASRPAIRVNQVGYLSGEPVRATAITHEHGPLDVVVRDSAGAVVAHGASRPWPVRPEPSSGLAVHILELDPPELHGDSLVIEAGALRSHPFRIGHDLYRGLARDALRVFRLLRSGTPVPEAVLAGYARPAGHAGLPPNRGDTAVPTWGGPDAARLYPGWRCEGTFDVSGGWYDAGDYGKYVTSGAIAAWQLLSTLDLLGATDTYLADTVRDECRWQLDWLLRMQVPDGFPLAGMAFHRVHGTCWSPLPGWAHEDPTPRVLHRPSTPATLHLAATAAHGARHFAAVDPGYAARLLSAARTAYTAASEHPQLPAPDDHARFGGGPYPDDDPSDDAYWAAAELWLTTGEQQYLSHLQRSEHHHADVFHDDGFDFDRVAVPARLDLALHGPQLPDTERIRADARAWADQLLHLQQQQPWGQPYAPAAGWEWGSNGRLLNNLVVLAAVHLLTGEAVYRDGVIRGLDHVLGRNALGQSYVTGYGTDFSHHQRTRQFGHDLDPTFPPPPPGALAGGPNSRPHADFPYDPRLLGLPPQLCYLDEPTSEVTNDICIRWNAPLVYAASCAQLRHEDLPAGDPPRQPG